MKSRFITIGSVVASIAVGQAIALAEDATTPNANRQQSANPGQQVTALEGKIMPLHVYLSGKSSWGSDHAGNAAASSSAKSTSQRDTSDSRNPNRAEQARDPANSTSPSADRNSASTAATTERSAATANAADASRTDASNPAWQGWAGTGAGDFSEQPLVFVAMRGTTTGSPSPSSTSSTSPSGTTTTDRNAPTADRNANALPSTSPAQGVFATSSFGEAYVLLCSSDAGSRSALSKAHSLIPSSNNRSATDRVQVRGKEDGDSTTSTTPRSEDQSRQQASDRSTTQEYKPFAQNYGHGVLEGKVVKVTGRILSRGGIQAIEVASIDDASSTSPTPSSGSSSDATSIK